MKITVLFLGVWMALGDVLQKLDLGNGTESCLFGCLPGFGRMCDCDARCGDIPCTKEWNTDHGQMTGLIDGKKVCVVLVDSQLSVMSVEDADTKKYGCLKGMTVDDGQWLLDNRQKCVSEGWGTVDASNGECQTGWDRNVVPKLI